MSNINELGTSIQDILGRQGSELLAQLYLANETASDMVQDFNVTTHAATNETVGDITARLIAIQQELGRIAADVASVQDEGNDLLRAWDIGALSAGPTPPRARPVVAKDAHIPLADLYQGVNGFDGTRPDRIAAARHRGMYEGMGISLQRLGCIMLDIEPLKVSDIIAPEDLYFAKNAERNPYLKGAVGEKAPHATLLHGLLQPGPEIQAQVDEVLSGWATEAVIIEDVGFFSGADPEEPNDCIVAHLRTTSSLIEANARLQLLPHIVASPPYRPHITLAYVRKDAVRRDDYIRLLKERYAGKKIRVSGINYGN